jgi:hypothetical protein
MLTAFFYAKGIIHHERMPEEQTVNSKFHKEVGPEFQEDGSRSLLHDNAPANPRLLL